MKHYDKEKDGLFLIFFKNLTMKKSFMVLLLVLAATGLQAQSGVRLGSYLNFNPNHQAFKATGYNVKGATGPNYTTVGYIQCSYEQSRTVLAKVRKAFPGADYYKNVVTMDKKDVPTRVTQKSVPDNYGHIGAPSISLNPRGKGFYNLPKNEPGIDGNIPTIPLDYYVIAVKGTYCQNWPTHVFAQNDFIAHVTVAVGEANLWHEGRRGCAIIAEFLELGEPVPTYPKGTFKRKIPKSSLGVVVDPIRVGKLPNTPVQTGKTYREAGLGRGN